MADPVVSFSNIKQGVDSDGQRTVEATLDFDTGTWNVDDLGIPIVLSSLGLKRVERAYVVASARPADPTTAYTQAVWVTANDTVTYNYFVDISTNGTKDAPRLVIFSAGNILTGAVAASAQVRIKFVGS